MMTVSQILMTQILMNLRVMKISGDDGYAGQGFQ